MDAPPCNVFPVRPASPNSTETEDTIIEVLVTVIITTSSDFRVHAHGGFFVDVRAGGEHGRQMIARNPGDRAGVDAFLLDLREAARRDPKNIRFEVIDRTS